MILLGFVDLLEKFASQSYFKLWLYPLLAYGFIISVPGIIRSSFTWR